MIGKNIDENTELVLKKEDDEVLLFEKRFEKRKIWIGYCYDSHKIMKNMPDVKTSHVYKNYHLSVVNNRSQSIQKKGSQSDT